MDIKKDISKAPQMPGVYLFKGKRGRVLYVGKAVNLRARLRSYANLGWKEDMLREAKNVSWEVLSSDIEALIREAELVKKHAPRYNILLRDDKNYFFVAFTHDLFPRVYLTHQPSQLLEVELPRGGRTSFIGPFTDGESIRRVLQLLRRAFPYCTCSRVVKHKRKCVNAEIGKCLGFCCAKIPHAKKDIAAYTANIAAIKKVLSGKTKTLKRELLKKMNSLTMAQRYEQASQARDQIASLERIFQHSPYLKKDIPEERGRALRALQELLHLPRTPARVECYDISHHQGDTPVASMVVFENGIPAKSQYRKFIMRSVSDINDPAMIFEVISRRMRHAEWTMPNLIVVDGGKTQLGAALRAVQRRVRVVSIAKREEELYLPGKKNPLPLKNMAAPVFHFVTHVRDEAHRFAVSFHRKRSRHLVFPTTLRYEPKTPILK